MLDASQDRLWGYQLCVASGVRSGILYPMLRRMLEAGWLVDGWEDPRELDGTRPPRRYYRLTTLGASELREIVASTGLSNRVPTAVAKAAPKPSTGS